MVKVVLGIENLVRKPDCLCQVTYFEFTVLKIHVDVSLSVTAFEGWGEFKMLGKHILRNSFFVFFQYFTNQI